MSQPSAPERRARKTSARRSSSMITGTCGSMPGRLVEPQRHRDGHPALRTDLQVEDRQVGLTLGDDVDDDPALATHGEVGVGPAERGRDLVDDPVGVGGEQDVHAADVTCGPAPAPNVS